MSVRVSFCVCASLCTRRTEFSVTRNIIGVIGVGDCASWRTWGDLGDASEKFVTKVKKVAMFSTPSFVLLSLFAL